MYFTGAHEIPQALEVSVVSEIIDALQFICEKHKQGSVWFDCVLGHFFKLYTYSCEKKVFRLPENFTQSQILLWNVGEIIFFVFLKV